MLRRKGEKSNRSYVACLPNLVDESLTFLYSSSALPRSNIFLKVGNFESSRRSASISFFLEYSTKI